MAAACPSSQAPFFTEFMYSQGNQSYGSGARENQILALLRKRCSIGINAHLLR
jgi:hypothetical protein